MSEAEVREIRTFFWDFFGPRAEATARHFKRHLHEFLAQHGCEALEVVEVSLQARHHAVGVVTPPERHALIEGALRPKRFTVASATDGI